MRPSAREDLLMVQRDGMWWPAPPPPLRRALLDEAVRIADRESRRLAGRNAALVLVFVMLWGASDPLCLDDALALALVITGLPRLLDRPRRDLLEVRDELAARRGFVIPGR